MDSGDPDDANVKGNVPFDKLEAHYRDHVVRPSLMFAVVILVLYAATLAWFLNQNGYENRQALVFLYGFIFLLGFVATWSVVHTMLTALGEAQSRVMNTLGTPVPAPPSELAKSIGNQSFDKIAALTDDQVKNLSTMASLSAGLGSPALARGGLPGAGGPTVVLKGFYDAARNLPDARFLVVAFVFLLLIAVSIDPNYTLPNLTIDMSPQETPTPTETPTDPPATETATPIATATA